MIGRSNAKARERGQSLIMLCLMMPMLLPLLGIGYDLTIIYSVQAKISSAVDGAVLGAGRLLGTSIANTVPGVEEVAGEFLAANFPGFPMNLAPGTWTSASSGYWGVNNYMTNIMYTPPSVTNPVRTVTISASVALPLMFARVFTYGSGSSKTGYSYEPVAAAGQATRRDARTIFVLDRSGSMDQTQTDGNTALQDVVSNAKQFTASFVDGVDEMGLVVFGASAVVAYPVYAAGAYVTNPGAAVPAPTTYPYGSTPRDATHIWGPDKNFNTKNGAGNSSPPDMVYMFGQVADGGNTGMAEAISLAYIELQRAHNADVSIYGYDPLMNTIVLFTDGVPNQFAVYVNNPASALATPTATPYTSSLLPYGTTGNTSPCTYNPNRNPGVTSTSSTCGTPVSGDPGSPNSTCAQRIANGNNGLQMVGSMGNIGGLYQLFTLDATDSTLIMVKNPGQSYGSYDLAAIKNSSALKNCGSGVLTPNSGNNPSPSLNALAYIPARDLYGNLTSGTNNTDSSISSISGTSYNKSSTTNGTQLQIAAWNAVYNAAVTIRTSTAAGAPITIYTIGYTGDGGTDDGLLQDVANDPNANSYVSTQPNGHYYVASNKAQIQAALANIASSILRLSQ